MTALNLANFNRKVQLGNVTTVKNSFTGASSKEFEKVLELWFASKKRTLSQQYQLQGTQLEHSRIIVIRHNLAVESLQMAVIDGVKYDILDYSPDDSSAVIRYDYLTLKRSS